MLRDGSVAVDGAFEAGDQQTWRIVHQRLRGLRRRRAALDAEEAALLMQAERLRLWRQFGFATMLDYLERVLGHTPREGMERMRVARALTTLPALSHALATDGLAYTVIRELTRKVTPQTEVEWLEHVRGKTTRQVDEMLAGHKLGDRPSDPVDPDLRTRPVTLELTPQARALLRQVRSQLADELGRSLDDAELVETLCRRAMEPATPSTKPAYQIALTVCDQCKRGTQNGAGREIPVGPEVLERARCDADHLGHLDAAVPARVTPTVMPRTRRQVFARDHHRCTSPGCASARNLEVHHIVWRERGGTHAMSNLTLLCSGCHAAVHDGLLAITGTAPHALAFQFRVPIEEPREPARVQNDRGPDAGEPSLQAETAAGCVDEIMSQAGPPLISLGFKPKQARAATRAAITRAGRALRIERLVLEALRASNGPSE